MQRDIQVVSTTDSAEHVKAVQSGKSLEEMAKIDAAASADTTKTEVEANTSTETQDDSDTSKTEEGETKPTRKNGFKKRIDKLNTRVADREREIDNLRAELAAARVQKPNQSDVVETKKADPTGRPNPDNFDKHDEYIEALTDWKTDQKLIADKKQTEEIRLKSEVQNDLQKKVGTFNAQAKEFAQKTHDYQKTLEAVDDIEMSAVVRDTVLESGPELAYALAKEPDEFEKICSMPEKQAIAALAVFNYKIKASATGTTTEKKEIKPKPAPLSTVQGKATGGKNPGEMTYAEYKAWWAETHPARG